MLTVRIIRPPHVEVIDLTGDSDGEPPTKKHKGEGQATGINTASHKSTSSASPASRIANKSIHSAIRPGDSSCLPSSASTRPGSSSRATNNVDSKLPHSPSLKGSANGRTNLEELLSSTEIQTSRDGRTSVDKLLAEAQADEDDLIPNRNPTAPAISFGNAPTTVPPRPGGLVDTSKPMLVHASSRVEHDKLSEPVNGLPNISSLRRGNAQRSPSLYQSLTSHLNTPYAVKPVSARSGANPLDLTSWLLPNPHTSISNTKPKGRLLSANNLSSSKSSPSAYPEQNPPSPAGLSGSSLPFPNLQQPSPKTFGPLTTSRAITAKLADSSTYGRSSNQPGHNIQAQQNLRNTTQPAILRQQKTNIGHLSPSMKVQKKPPLGRFEISSFSPVLPPSDSSDAQRGNLMSNTRTISTSQSRSSKPAEDVFNPSPMARVTASTSAINSSINANQFESPLGRKEKLVLKAFYLRSLPVNSKIRQGSRNSSSDQTNQMSGPLLSRSLQQRGRPPGPRNASYSSMPLAASSTETPTFDASRMPLPVIEDGKRPRAAFTPADYILIIYFEEIKRYPPYIIDEKLGRDYWRAKGLSRPPASSPCHIRYGTHLRDAESPDRMKLNLRISMPALQQILTLDWDIPRTRQALDVFMTTGQLPAALQLPHLGSFVDHGRNTDNKSPPKRRHRASPLSGLETSDPPRTKVRRPARAEQISNSLDQDLAAAGSSLLESRGRRNVPAVQYGIPKPEAIDDDQPIIYEVRKSALFFMKEKAPQDVIQLPYLSEHERDSLDNALRCLDWGKTLRSTEAFDFAGENIHVKFQDEEIQAILTVAMRMFQLRARDVPEASSPALRLSNLLSGLRSRSNQIITLASEARNSLRHRTKQSIMSFLHDVLNDQYHVSPSKLTIQPQRAKVVYPVLKREMGFSQRPTRDKVYHSFGPVRSFNEMSGDVDYIAFSPNGYHFAASGCCLTDAHNMQYNDPINLIAGDLRTNTVNELSDHWRRRKPAETGVNSTDLMLRIQDPRLFYTVPMVQFSKDGSHLYSIGYDGRLNAYDVTNSYARTTREIGEGIEVSLLAVSNHHRLVATGSRVFDNSISVFSHSNDGIQKLFGTYCTKARDRPEYKIYPSSLKWGNSFNEHILAGGFSSNKGEETGERDTNGELCLWDVRTGDRLSVYGHSGSVLDLSWSKTGREFVAAMVPQGTKATVNRWAKSVIRIYGDAGMHWSARGIEFECQARDINDVVFW
jgi:hypothetical protein